MKSFHKYIIIITIFYLSCGNNYNEYNPCENVNCGNGGVCKIESGFAWCDCGQGYIADGLICVAADADAGVDGGNDGGDEDAAMDTYIDVNIDTYNDSNADISADIINDASNDISQCIDNDMDGYGTNCSAGDDCNDSDINNWISCDSCVDNDNDSYYIGCDSYTTISGPDCDDTYILCTTDCSDNNSNEISDCREDCDDQDEDGYGDGTGCIGEDCDDENPNCNSDCTDNDSDTYCIGSDCDDNNYNCTSDCTDNDNDTYCLYIDCDDDDTNNWTDCDSCIDNDQDSYYVGCNRYETINGSDCNDNNIQIYPSALKQCDNISLDYDCNGILDNYEGCFSMCPYDQVIESINQNGNFTASGTINKIFVAGSYAYLAVTDDNNSLTIVDTKNMGQTAVKGVNTDGKDVLVYNNDAYLVTDQENNNGLHVINVTDPTNPSNPTSYSTNFNANAIFYYSKRLFVGEESGSNNLQGFNWDSAGTMNMFGEVSANNNINDLTAFKMNNNRYIIAAVNRKIQLFQRSGDSISSVFLSSSDVTSNDILSIFYYNDNQQLYITDASRNIYNCSIDTSTPSVNCTSIDLTFSRHDIFLREDYIFTSSNGYIAVGDINNTTITYDQASGDSCNSVIYVTDTNIFIACNETIYKYSFDCCAPLNTYCSDNNDCCTGICDNNNCRCLNQGESCGSNDDCCSGWCNNSSHKCNN